MRVDGSRQIQRRLLVKLHIRRSQHSTGHSIWGGSLPPSRPALPSELPCDDRPLGAGVTTGAQTVRKRCPQCGRRLIRSVFDATFGYRPGDPRTPNLHGGPWAAERRVYAMPMDLCEDCRKVYIDPDLIDICELEDMPCTFAIESPVILRELVESRE
jgi:hypothetical protein